MRKTLALALAALLVACFASYSFAYEFEMKGEYEYRFRWFERTGNLDLFGNSQAQMAGPPLAAAAALGPNTPDIPNNGASSIVGFAGPSFYTSPTWNWGGVNEQNFGQASGRIAGMPLPSANALVNIPSMIGSNWSTRNDLVEASGTFGLASIPAGTNARWLAQPYITRGGFSRSESNALYNDMRMTLYPTIRVNPAIRVHGVYNVGGYRNKYAQHAGGVGVPPFERYYMSQTSMNAGDTAAIGSWEQFRMTVNIPWGTLSLGVKDFPLGTGATLANNTRAESFLMVVPYGPMRFLGACWLGRNRGLEGYATSPDGAQKNGAFWGMIMTYDDGPLSAGLGTIHRMFHGDQRGAVGNAARDDNTLINLAYFKYFNGRFFANAEYAWINVDRYRNAAGTPAATGIGGGSQTVYLEGYHLFTEAGTVCGPMKLSLMYALSSGYVQNNQNKLINVSSGGLPGFLNGGANLAPMTPGFNPKVYVPFAINYQATEPYEFLMFNTYAGGNLGSWNVLDVAFTQDEHGQMTDAYAFAGRVDYAVASNLNIWASYIWAHRLERAGTFYGQYTSTGQFSGPMQTINPLALAAFYANTGRGAVGAVGAAAGNPYISDGFIGWEANGGVDWKLLEGLTFKGRYSYWVPGEYFRDAYQAVILTAGGGVNLYGSQNSRDAIQAFQGSLLVEF